MFYFLMFISCLIPKKQPLEDPCAAQQEEIQSLQAQLEKAKQEKKEVQLELLDTIADLKEQIERNKELERQATENLWLAFRAETKEEACWGGRRRQYKCHKAFEQALNEQLKTRFMHCILDQKETPVLGRTGEGEALPENAVYLGEEEAHLVRWYVQFCEQKNIVPDQDGE